MISHKLVLDNMEGGKVHAYVLGQLEINVKEHIMHLERLKALVPATCKDIVESMVTNLNNRLNDGSELIKKYNDSV